MFRKAITGLVSEFTTTLNEQQRGQLLSVMMRIRQDHSLIGRIAQFVHTPPTSPKKKEEPSPKPTEHDKQPKNV